MKTPLTLCSRSQSGDERDWVDLYEQAFPVEERAEVDALRKDIALGRRQLHRTLAVDETLLCFSLIFTAFDDFLFLSYIATAEQSRSQGIGWQHLSQLIAELETQFAGKKALLLEIESPDQPGIDAATAEIRRRRLDFYMRHGAQRMPPGKTYLMPNFVSGMPPLPAELLWFPLRQAQGLDLASIIPQIYAQIYGLPADDELVSAVAEQFAGVD